MLNMCSSSIHNGVENFGGKLEKNWGGKFHFIFNERSTPNQIPNQGFIQEKSNILGPNRPAAPKTTETFPANILSLLEHNM